MQIKRFKPSSKPIIYLLALCLGSWLVCLPTQAAPPTKPQKGEQKKLPVKEQVQEQLQEPIEHPAAWSDAIPYYNLANKYLEKERYEDAVDNYHEAIARFPNDPDFYINLGYSYRKLEDFESAEQAFRKALLLNNKDWMTWSNLANALLKQNKLTETVSTFEKCLKLTMPASERAAINRDIADIKKILAMRQPKPAVTSGKGALALPVSKQINAVTSGKPSNPTKKSPRPAQAKAENKPESQPEDNREDKTKSSGWDYVYK